MWNGAKQAFADYRTWLFVVMQHCVLLAQTVTFFFPSIVSTLGYGKVISESSLAMITGVILTPFSAALLLTAPVWFASKSSQPLREASFTDTF